MRSILATIFLASCTAQAVGGTGQSTWLADDAAVDGAGAGGGDVGLSDASSLCKMACETWGQCFDTTLPDGKAACEARLESDCRATVNCSESARCVLSKNASGQGICIVGLDADCTASQEPVCHLYKDGCMVWNGECVRSKDAIGGCNAMCQQKWPGSTCTLSDGICKQD